MKKLFLLMMGAGISAFTVNAQQVANKSFVFDGKTHTVKALIEPSKKLVMPKKEKATTNTANKTTANPRWYSYFEDVDALNSGNLQNNLAVMPIWFDPTIKQTFTTGDDTINYLSTCLFMDPIRFQLYNDIGLHNGEMQISLTDAYTVDSIRISGVYEESMNRPSTVVDTLILSVAPSTGRYSLSKTAFPEVAPYLSSTQDTLYAYTPFNVDSVNKAVVSDVASVTRIMWKVPLTDAMRDTGFNIQTLSFEVPGGLNVPAGNSFSIAVTFKSGDSWTPYASNIDTFHRFMPLTSFIGAGQRMAYYYYTYNDRNNSNMMFSSDSSRYLPSVIIEAINTPDFRNEYHVFDAHILCPTCSTVGTASVNDIKTAATVGDVYPNPAFNAITVPFTMTESANVNVVITNATGAKVATQNLGKYNANQRGTATFDVTNFPNGVYFYTVEANGQRVTKRFVVTH